MWCANERSAAVAFSRCGHDAFGKSDWPGCTADTAARSRFAATPSVEAKILNATRKPPTDGSTHWSTRRLAAKLGVSHMMVAGVWNKHRLQPHRLERYMSSNDPDFEPKAADIIGLYLNPPAHAAVFCVDEKTAIQALDRNDPVLPLSPGRAERHGFEYYRHGTLALYAAFNTKTGEVIGKTAARHTSEQFVAFLTDIVAHQLNQVELWFAKISRDVIARGVFSSVADLKSKLMRYIRQYNKKPRVVKWHYVDPSRHIGA